MTIAERCYFAVLAKGIENAYGAATAVQNLYPTIEVEVCFVGVSEEEAETIHSMTDYPTVRFDIDKDGEEEIHPPIELKFGMHHSLATMRERTLKVLKERGIKARRGLAI